MATRQAELLERLEASARAGLPACGGWIASKDATRFTFLCSDLMRERAQYKLRIIDQLLDENYGNWNETFYNLYFRTLGDKKNQEAFLELSRRVTYKNILRERLTPNAIEAMLLGASGLLELYPEDRYVALLKQEFRHLSAKYDIEPMAVEQWNLHEIRPANHPVLRLSQAAAFFLQDDFLMDRILRCRTEEDIHALFCIESGHYWHTHYTPGAESEERPKRLGHFKASMIGINLVSTLQLAYSLKMGKEELYEQAINLLERMKPEDNRYIRLWQSMGVRPRDAAQTQALLQLSTVYCAAARCKECPIAQRMMMELELKKKD